MTDYPDRSVAKHLHNVGAALDRADHSMDAIPRATVHALGALVAAIREQTAVLSAIADAQGRPGESVTFLPTGSSVNWSGYSVIDVVAMRTPPGTPAAEFLTTGGRWLALNDISVLHIPDRVPATG